MDQWLKAVAVLTVAGHMLITPQQMIFTLMHLIVHVMAGHNLALPTSAGLKMAWVLGPPLIALQGDRVFLAVNVTADESFYNRTHDFFQP